MPILLHIRNGAVIGEHELQPGNLRIGRKPDNDIRLDDSTVSGHHAVLTVKPSPYMDGLYDIYVDDLGSTNGTLVNGTPVEHHRLQHDDIVSTGTHEFKVVNDEGRPLDRTRLYLPEDAS